MKKLVSPDHHVEVQQHRSGTRPTPPHTRPTTQHTHTHTHQGKEEREKLGKREKRKEGKGNPHHTTPRTTKHPLTTQAHTMHHTDTTHKGKEGKGKGKRGSLYVWSGYDVWYECGL